MSGVRADVAPACDRVYNILGDAKAERGSVTILYAEGVKAFPIIEKHPQNGGGVFEAKRWRTAPLS